MYIKNEFQKNFLLFLVFMGFILSYSIVNAQISPYPPSTVIESVNWHTNTHVSAAPGSDLWANTWGPDDNVYVSWGDGGGFGGTNSDGRVSMGFALIKGPPESYTATNINGGKNSKFSATWSCSSCGKSSGILSVDGTLYAWQNAQDGSWPNVNYYLWWSTDLGRTWQKSSWNFPSGTGKFKPNRFLQFGKDYRGARDGYVYFYGFNQDEYGKSYIGRVIKENLKTKSTYEYFVGLGVNDIPIWTSDINKRKPHFVNPNSRTGICNACTPANVVYNPGIGRYLYVNSYGKGGEVGVFEGPEPWGPWYTVAYYNNWIGGNDGGNSKNHGLQYGFVNKWTSTDGLTMWLIFNFNDGNPKYDDRFNLIKATLKLKSTAPPPSPPPPPSSGADINSDGKVDVTDLGILLSNWGASGSADINNDGVVDVTDLGIMLSNWS